MVKIYLKQIFDNWEDIFEEVFNDGEDIFDEVFNDGEDIFVLKVILW